MLFSGSCSRSLGFSLVHNRLNVLLRNSLQAIDELGPAHVTIVADDRNRRYAAAFDDDVTLRRFFDAIHFADAVLVAAGETELVVPELIEEAEHAALYRRGSACAAERGNILHGTLADLARVRSGAARNSRIEA